MALGERLEVGGYASRSNRHGHAKVQILAFPQSHIINKNKYMDKTISFWASLILSAMWAIKGGFIGILMSALWIGYAIYLTIKEDKGRS